jgi:DNA helicase-2/ATP-dependent DNA helicase PcrA
LRNKLLELLLICSAGSGKTKTLTTRVAKLLTYDGFAPWNIIVATFTVKAANEMKERVGKLVGEERSKLLLLGTFHSIARRYLVRYGHLIDLPRDFGIADTSDSSGILKRILKRRDIKVEASSYRSRISSLKARSISVDEYELTHKSVQEQEFTQIYRAYEEALRIGNLLDYDDLLLRCLDLLRAHPKVVKNVQAVLIDEFQDTNVVQFELMQLLAGSQRRITIVGDP